MKKHIELTEQEIKRIKEFKVMTEKPKLFKVITETLEYIKANDDCFDYVSMPSVCYSKPFYLFYGGELVGQLNMELTYSPHLKVGDFASQEIACFP